MTHNFLMFHGPDDTPLYVRAESVVMFHAAPPVVIPKGNHKPEYLAKSVVTFEGGTLHVRETVDEILQLLDRIGR